MQRTLMVLFGLALAATSMQSVHAQNRGGNNSLPKVDFQVVQISPVGMGLAIHVKNGGFVRSSGTSVSVVIYNAQRQIVKTQSLAVSALQPGQQTRVIVVPPANLQSFMLKATVDPGNHVQESNERNNIKTFRR